MKSTLIYSLMIVCCAQPALAQQWESDADFAKQAAKELGGSIGGQRPQQPVAKKVTAPVKQQRAKVQSNGGYAAPVRQNNNFGTYGYRPQRSNVRTSYGYRPQRSDLLPPGYTQEMLQARMAKLQQMQKMMGAAGGGAGMPGMGAGMPGMGAGMPQQGGKPNFLQMLMGGGAGGGMPQQQQQMPMQQPQFNRGEMLKQMFGGGGMGEQTGE